MAPWIKASSTFPCSAAATIQAASVRMQPQNASDGFGHLHSAAELPDQAVHPGKASAGEWTMVAGRRHGNEYTHHQLSAGRQGQARSTWHRWGTEEGSSDSEVCRVRHVLLYLLTLGLL